MPSEIVLPRIEQLAERPEWLPVVAEWIYNEWWTPVTGASTSTVADLLREHRTLDVIPLTLIASVEDHPVGTATLLPHDVGTDPWPELSPWLAAVYVMPEHRRHGIGASLVHAAAAKAAALGVETLYLLTSGREGFYARMSWSVLDRRGGEVVMLKRTAP